MSSLKLLHSGGNGVTISAPSSNPAANRTITLNDNYAGDGSFVTANSSGNVGLGTASPACNLHVSAANPRARFTSTGNTVNYDIFMGSTTATVGTSSNHDTVFMTNDAERMRVLSSGSLCIGVDTTADNEKVRIDGSGSNANMFLRFGSTDDKSMIRMRHSRNTGGTSARYIRIEDAGGTERGTISATTSGTSYGTSSDYRLKENITAISDGITRLKTLKPSKFNFIGDSKIVDGFIAHEVTAVPEAITGTKDEVDSDNNPVYQGIDQSKLVPLLTAALQEEVAKREALEARVAALEGA